MKHETLVDTLDQMGAASSEYSKAMTALYRKAKLRSASPGDITRELADAKQALVEQGRVIDGLLEAMG